MIKKIPLVALISLLLIVGSYILYVLAWQQWDNQLTQRALFDLSLQQQNKTPFIWNFAHATDLHGDYNELGQLSFSDNGLSTITKGRDTYFTVNLKQRTIHKSYNQLRLSIYASKKSQLQIFFKNPEHTGFIFGSGLQTVHPGWQVLTVNLDKKIWYAIKLPEWSKEDPVPLRQWGSDSGVISSLRLDLGDQEDVEFKIKKLTILQRKPEEKLSSLTFSANDLPKNTNTLLALDLKTIDAPTFSQWLKKNKDNTLFIADSSSIKTPESQYRLQQSIIQIAPKLVFFPSVPDRNTIKQINQTLKNPSQITDAKWPLYSWRNTVIGLMLLLSLSAVFFIIKKGNVLYFHQANALLITGLMFCLWWVVNHSNYGLLLAIPSVIFIACLGLYYSPYPLKNSLGLNPPNKQLLLILFFSALPFIVLILSSAFYREGASNNSNFLLPLLIYPLWAFIQQIFLGPILANSFNLALSNTTYSKVIAAILAGFIFAILHYPNMVLMLATFFLASLWAWLFLQYRSIVPLAIAHGLLGFLFREFSSGIIRLDGDVGPAFFQWLYL